MKKRVVLFVVLLMTGLLTHAQRFTPDIVEMNLKGPVKSVLTTVRTPQGRVVGQPVRNNFNHKGYFTHNTYYDTLGNPVIIVHYTYDSKDRLIKDIRTLEPFSELLSQTTYVYDKKNRTITAEMFGIADSLIQNTVYYYDKKDMLQRVTTFDEKGLEIASSNYTYNEYGFKVYVSYTEGENMIYKGADKFRYDTDGFLAEKCSYYLTTLRQAFLYTYLYDEQGNWTQAYVYHVSPTEGYLYQVISRQITYFE
ncbi:MAG: hypothetical protein J5848_01050 [Bacteroidales bacterium]|nr:hypothetical protein [Bacteroidales bacterium]